MIHAGPFVDTFPAWLRAEPRSIPEHLRQWVREAYEGAHLTPDRSRAVRLAVIREMGETRDLLDPAICVSFGPHGEPLTISWDS